MGNIRCPCCSTPLLGKTYNGDRTQSCQLISPGAKSWPDKARLRATRKLGRFGDADAKTYMADPANEQDQCREQFDTQVDHVVEIEALIKSGDIKLSDERAKL